MGCGTPIVLSSPYNYCSFSINNVSAELIKIFPLNPNSIISISTKEYKIGNYIRPHSKECIACWPYLKCNYFEERYIFTWKYK